MPGRWKEAFRDKKIWLLGPVIGLLNGFFGAGGGMVAVPLLQKLGLKREECHATSMAVILPLAALSGFFYLSGGNVRLAEAAAYMPGGLLGALAGGWLLPRIKTSLLRKIFGAAALLTGLRLLLR